MRIKIILVLGIIGLLFFNAKRSNPKGEKLPASYKYLLYLPDSYDSSKGEFPLLIYLHGASVRGNELNKIKAYGLPFLIDKGENFDFIVVSPQCPASKSWSSENWFEPLYKELSEKYQIDSNRVYITGMSLGGYGAWNTAMEYPFRFAAVVPLCGGGDIENVCELSNIPVWTFHGTADSLVPISETEKLVNALKKCNGNIKFTRLEGKGHSIHWVYEDKEIYSWMLKQNKANNGKLSENKKTEK